MCISIPFYFKYLTGELFVHRWCSSKCKLQRMVANRARNGLSQILNSFLLGCNLLTRSCIFCIGLLLCWGFSYITAARNAVCWMVSSLTLNDYYRINFYSQTIINTSPFKQSFSMTAFKEIKGSEIQL